jgi:hypothetical protein
VRRLEMGIRDDVGEISENNVTIAETQEKVYNAGVRAGMMQDPDYSEGYADGYEQGLSDSSGVVWEDLLSGKVPVGKAKEADHADKATNAENAENAKNANHAASATNAGHAETATNADHAVTATIADHAETATIADHAETATNAGHADEATSATNADHATTATVAASLSGVISIENGGTGGKSPEQAWENLNLERLLATYQKPWDVNENVGLISNNIEVDIYLGQSTRWSSDVCVLLDNIPMINTGNIYLDLNTSGLGGGSFGNNFTVNVSLDDEIVYRSDKLVNKPQIEEALKMIPLTVTKGTHLKAWISYHKDIDPDISAHNYFTSSDSVKYALLLANIDTPYKYISIDSQGGIK